MTISQDGLVADFMAAKRDYEGRWREVDRVLYDVAAERGHGDMDDVYTKVVLVNRVYAAGLSRSSRGPGDPETDVAHGLVSISDELGSRLASLADRPLNAALVTDIVGLHHAVAKSLLGFTGDRWMTSFVSKYLHFHAPCVPIFDDRAVAAVAKYAATCGDRHYLVEPEWRVAAYWNFVRRFYDLYACVERSEMGEQVTVKLVDHMLWRYT